MSKTTLGSDAARAVGIFREEGPLGYVASTAPDAKLRTTRALAVADERRHLEGTLTHGALFAGYDGIGLALESLFPGTELAWYSEFDAAPSGSWLTTTPTPRTSATSLGSTGRARPASTFSREASRAKTSRSPAAAPACETAPGRASGPTS